MEFLDQEWVKIVGSILGIAVTVILRSLSQNLRGLLNTLKDRSKDMQFQNTLTHAIDVINSITVTMEHTIVPKLKEASKDGKLTQDEIEQIVAMTKSEIAKIIGPEKQSLLEDFLGDYELWVDTKVRATILKVANRTILTQ